MSERAATSPTAPTIGNVLYSVADIEAAVRFYETLALPLKFRDGDRFAAFDAGTTFALAAGDEALVSGRAAASFRVADVDATFAALVAAGAQALTAPQDGPHERRAVLSDPWQNVLVLYSRLPAPEDSP
ncbi:MAG: hypothetical protein QOK11_3646 [Pseudonocardiales bacterium]|jgi:predicted enzyme related to lactoylglutathione lyase|nr:hypothetical protein [Pseudonocardiales bacterium]